MADKTSFTLRTGRGYINTFGEDKDIFTTVATAMATRFTTDLDHESCMKVSAADNKGVEVYVSNLKPETRHSLEFAYKSYTNIGVRVGVHDMVGSASILTGTGIGSTWRNFSRQFSTPADCSVVRIRLMGNTAAKRPFYVDDFKLQGNVLAVDPDAYNYQVPDKSYDHEKADGNITIDRSGRHMAFQLAFPMLAASHVARFIDFGRSIQPGYFDDGNLPIMTNSAVLKASKTFNFVDVTSPSSGNKAYKSATTGTPVSAAMMQSTEFTDAEYNAVSTVNSVFATTVVTGAGDYGYQKFMFKATTFAAATQIYKLSVYWKGKAEDESVQNVDGAKLLAWDGVNWVELGETVTPDLQILSFDTSRKEHAKQFVDTTSNWIRLLVRTRGAKQASGALTLKTDYVRATVNDKLSRRIPLTNKAHASAAVTRVKNLSVASVALRSIGYQAAATTIITDVEHDGTYLYAANHSNGLLAFKFDGTHFRLCGSVDDGGSARGLFVSSTGYIFLANYDDVRVYTFDGSTFTAAGSDATPTATYGIWYDGTHVFVACGSEGLRAYGYDGATLTLLNTIDEGGTAMDVTGDGTNIFLSNQTDGLRAYTFDGDEFTAVGHVDPGSIWGVYCDGTYLHCASDTGGLVAYTFDGEDFSEVATSTDASQARGIWGDGKLLYVADHAYGIKVFSFDGSEYTLLGTIDDGGNGSRVYGDGDIIFLANDNDGIRAYTYKDYLVHGVSKNGYVLGDDRRSVVVTSDVASSANQEIEVKYQFDYEVKLDGLAVPTVFAGDVSDPHSILQADLRTITKIEK